jgi:hypothetical protein
LSDLFPVDHHDRIENSSEHGLVLDIEKNVCCCRLLMDASAVVRHIVGPWIAVAAAVVFASASQAPDLASHHIGRVLAASCSEPQSLVQQRLSGQASKQRQQYQMVQNLVQQEHPFVGQARAAAGVQHFRCCYDFPENDLSRAT